MKVFLVNQTLIIIIKNGIQNIMSKLYSELAHVYYEMYLSLFDYEKEFNFYDNYLKKYKCKSILELGCGNGNLASYFLKSNYTESYGPPSF